MLIADFRQRYRGHGVRNGRHITSVGRRSFSLLSGVGVLPVLFWSGRFGFGRWWWTKKAIIFGNSYELYVNNIIYYRETVTTNATAGKNSKKDYTVKTKCGED
jgi:hypothetical protein